MGQKIAILHSVSLEDPSTYDDDFEAKVFLGAHTSIEHAKLFATQVVGAEAGEYGVGAPALVWEEQSEQVGPGAGKRPYWTSRRVDLLDDGTGYYFELKTSELDPEL